MMKGHLQHDETRLATYLYRDVPFELIRKEKSIYVGTVGYAPNMTDEPDIAAVLARYQSLVDVPKREKSDPAWSVCISIDYWRNGAAPRGICFAQQTLVREQDPRYDVYEMPASLFIRVQGGYDTAQKLLGRDSCELYELFGFAREVMRAEGYTANDNGAQELELYGSGVEYAYVQVKK